MSRSIGRAFGGYTATQSVLDTDVTSDSGAHFSDETALIQVDRQIDIY